MLNGIRVFKFFSVFGLIAIISVSAFADTIRMKDGSVIKGKIVEFKDQQFIIAIGNDSRGRKRQLNVFADEIESITFDTMNTAVASAPVNTPVNNTPAKPVPAVEKTVEKVADKPLVVDLPKTSTVATQPPVKEPVKEAARGGVFVPVSNNIKVLADNTSNGWTNSGFVVKRGQRLRITAKGNISLGNGRFARPEGDTSYTDSDKLVAQKPTGGLVAVIGDDNDEFIFIGASFEFVAQRDGTLFLGINEGNLQDNSGAYDVTVETEVN